MTTLTEISISPAVDVSVSDELLTVKLADGREISVPTAWYPRLANGTAKERSKWTISYSGRGLHWEALDEDISVKGLIAGLPSNENPTNIKKWIENRTSRMVAEEPTDYKTKKEPK
jgi:hypothetical protein